MKLNDKIVCDLCGRSVAEENAIKILIPIKKDEEHFYTQEKDACNYCANKINACIQQIMVGEKI